MTSTALPAPQPFDALLHRYVRPALLHEAGGVYLFRCARRDTPDVPLLVQAMGGLGPDGIASRRGVRFLREAEIGARLLHPHIVTNTAVEIVDGVALCEVSHAGTRNLGETLHTGRPLPYPRVLEILREIAAALDFAHSRGIVHGALRPAVVQFDLDGQVKVSGFTLYAHERSPALRPSQVGDPAYMAPEQWNDAEAERALDIYALGAIAYEMCSGHPRVAPGASGAAEILPFDLPATHRIGEEIPLPATAAIRRATSANAALRFPTATDFVSAMAEPADVSGAGLSTYKPPVHQQTRAPWLLLLLGLLLAVVLVIAVVPALREQVVNLVVGRTFPT